MRQLRLVHRNESGSLIVETTDDNEQFALPVDAVLRTAVRADLPRPAGEQAPDTAPAATTTAAAAAAPLTGEAPIGPREIQVRVRAGESPEQLAAAYDMSLDRVLRFAGPVMDERRRIADDARRSRARRSTAEGQIVVFGEAVDQRFAAHGIAPDAVRWDARRRDDGEWVVSAEWSGGGFVEGVHAAEWTFSRATRTVTPMDDTAGDLLSDRPIRPIAPPEPDPSQRPSLVAAPPLRPGVVSFPPMPDAHTGPVAVLDEQDHPADEVFDQDAPEPADDAEHRATTPMPSAVETTMDFDAPPLPLGLTDLPALQQLRDKPRRESEDERAARARVPSWDDILLGVRRNSE